MKPRAVSHPLVVLTDSDIRSAEGRPRRIFDSGPLRRRLPSARYAVWMTARDDVDLDRRLNRLGSQRFRRVLQRVIGLLFVLRQLPALRRAPVVFCLAPHHFWWLALLWRLGLLPTRGKTIAAVFSRSRPFLAKLALVKRLPPAFQPFFMVPRQIEDLRRAGCPGDKVHGFTWRIDTRWFQPAPRRPGAGDYLLCPGMAYRDEGLIRALVGRTPLRLIRATRTASLVEAYRRLAPKPGTFDFRLVLDHHEYLDLLQQAALVLLPIATSDEPAGLTTALEAMACGVPLLANTSYGVDELLADGYHRAPLPDNSPDTWLAAIREVLKGRAITAADRRRARTLVTSRHGLGSPDDVPDFGEIPAIRPLLTRPSTPGTDPA